MKKISYLKIILILFLIVSCNNNEAKIKEAENILNNTKVNFDKYSQQDWDKADTVFTSLENDLDKNRGDYTPEQIENANKVIGRYKAIKIKKTFNGLKETIEDVGQQIKGALDVFSDTTDVK
jgi:hypothetical protein